GSKNNPVRLGHSRGGIGAGPGLPCFVLCVLTGDEEGLKVFAGNRDAIQEFNQSAILTQEIASKGYLSAHNGLKYDSPVKLGDVIWADSIVPLERMNSSKWLSYRWCCSATAWHAWTLFADAVAKHNTEAGNVRAKTGHELLFQYLDIHDSEAKRLGKAEWERGFSTFMLKMWDTYRDSLGPKRFSN